MGEWLLSRRNRLIVARHEVPGERRREAPSRRDGRSQLSVPQIFVVETEPRHEQATARRMLVPLRKRQVFLWKSSGPMMFD
jgi:hypothetical protein